MTPLSARRSVFVLVAVSACIFDPTPKQPLDGGFIHCIGDRDCPAGYSCTQSQRCVAVKTAPPGLVSASVEYVPRAGNPITHPTAAGKLTDAWVRLAFDKNLATPPTISECEGSFSCRSSAVSESNYLFVCEALVDQQTTTCSPKIHGVDSLGQQVDTSTGFALRLDNDPPRLPADALRVVQHPWGGRGVDAGRSSEVLLALDASVEVTPDLETSFLTLRVFDTDQGEEISRGLLTGPQLTVGTRHVGRTWAQLVDSAGNGSPRVEVPEVTWLATFTGKMTGRLQENPHTAVASGDCTATPFQPNASDVSASLGDMSLPTLSMASRRTWSEFETSLPALSNAVTAYDSLRGRTIAWSPVDNTDRVIAYEWTGTRFAPIEASDPENDSNPRAFDHMSLTFVPESGAAILTNEGAQGIWLWTGASWDRGPNTVNIIEIPHASAWDPRTHEVLVFAESDTESNLLYRIGPQGQLLSPAGGDRSEPGHVVAAASDLTSERVMVLSRRPGTTSYTYERNSDAGWTQLAEESDQGVSLTLAFRHMPTGESFAERARASGSTVFIERFVGSAWVLVDRADLPGATSENAVRFYDYPRERWVVGFRQAGEPVFLEGTTDGGWYTERAQTRSAPGCRGCELVDLGPAGVARVQAESETGGNRDVWVLRDSNWYQLPDAGPERTAGAIFAGFQPQTLVQLLGKGAGANSWWFDATTSAVQTANLPLTQPAVAATAARGPSSALVLVADAGAFFFFPDGGTSAVDPLPITWQREESARVVYDSKRDRFLAVASVPLAQNAPFTNNRAAVFELLDGGTWRWSDAGVSGSGSDEQLLPYFRVVYDPDFDGLVIFGGRINSTSPPSSNVLEWVNETGFKKVSPYGAEISRSSFGMAYQPAFNRTIVQGGTGPGTSFVVARTEILSAHGQPGIQFDFDLVTAGFANADQLTSLAVEVERVGNQPVAPLPWNLYAWLDGRWTLQASKPLAKGALEVLDLSLTPVMRRTLELRTQPLHLLLVSGAAVSERPIANFRYAQLRATWKN